MTSFRASLRIYPYVFASLWGVALAAVFDEKKLEWDRPVREYLAWFRMYDPVATELITPRDLLTHRSGLAEA